MSGVGREESGLVGTFPFGRPATVRPPRPAVDAPAKVFVLGVYPSALHVRWSRPDGAVHVQSLAVDDEPEVFWDGADAPERVERWKDQVGWRSSWGSVTASGNGTSGRGVERDVLRPLGVLPADTYFTDCYRRYLVKSGTGSQQAAIDRAYGPFAAARGLPAASLPPRPSDGALVRMALEEDGGELMAQVRATEPDVVVTLGQPAADVLVGLLDMDRVVLRRDAEYGQERLLRVGRRAIGVAAAQAPGSTLAGVGGAPPALGHRSS